MVCAPATQHISCRFVINEEAQKYHLKAMTTSTHPPRRISLARNLTKGKVIIGAAIPSSVTEYFQWHKQIDILQKDLSISLRLQFLQQNMFVIPVSFAKGHKAMLAHCKELFEYQNCMTAIHPRLNKLITALRTAVENGEGMPAILFRSNANNTRSIYRSSLNGFVTSSEGLPISGT